jgi:hypothetical protein
MPASAGIQPLGPLPHMQMKFALGRRVTDHAVMNCAGCAGALSAVGDEFSVRTSEKGTRADDLVVGLIVVISNPATRKRAWSSVPW